jgi:hypothetical protein
MELPPSKGTRYLPYYALPNGHSQSQIPPKDASVSSGEPLTYIHMTLCSEK